MDPANHQRKSPPRKARPRAGLLARRLENQADMLALVAHDLRHPLFRIALAADYASEIESDDAGLARSLTAIREGLASMSRLVEDLDDYGSLQAGRLRLVRRRVQAAALAESAFAAFGLLASSREIQLSTRIDDDMRDQEVEVDRDRIFQVVSNLLANAICVTPRGGTVAVAVQGDGDLVRFTVSDSGPGITPADLPHLFERYWRGPHGGCIGRGLGLAIANDLILSHGGKLWAENDPLGGARFSFTVPQSSVPQSRISS